MKSVLTEAQILLPLKKRVWSTFASGNMGAYIDLLKQDH